MARKQINIRAGFDLAAFSESQQNLIRGLRKTATEMKSIGRQMSMSITGPLVAMGGLAVKTFADFEQSMAKVQAKSFSSSALDLDRFSESMKYVAPVAASAGISIEETSAMLSILANNGVKGSQAGTSLRRIISDLGATGDNVSESIANLAEKGLNLADAKDEVGRTAQSALLFLSKGVNQIKPLTAEYENAAGAAEAMAGIMDDTLQGSKSPAYLQNLQMVSQALIQKQKA